MTVESVNIAGMRTSNLEISTWRHLDINDLARQLDAYDGPPPIITTDCLFGISGEFSDLQRIAELAKQKNALIFSDDSHALFSVGESGRGSSQQGSDILKARASYQQEVLQRFDSALGSFNFR